MKKINVLLAATAICFAFASTSFAAPNITGSTTIGGGTYAPSAKVGVSIKSNATAYAATSAHLSGTYQYGTVGGVVVAPDDPTKIKQATIPSQTGLTVGTPTDVATAGVLPASVTWQ